MDAKLHDILLLLHYYFPDEMKEPEPQDKLPDDLVLPREFVKAENWSSFKN